jgi:hypothetical protein
MEEERETAESKEGGLRADSTATDSETGDRDRDGDEESGI